MSENIDINDLSLQDEVVEVDKVSGEEFLGRKLPDDKVWDATAALGSEGITVGTQSPEKGGGHFLKVHLAASLKDDTGAPAGIVFDRLNSVVYEREGKKSSRLHATLDILGAEVPAGTKLPDLYTLTQEALAQNPSLRVETQWQASSKAETQEEVDRAIAAGYSKKGKLEVGQYYTFLRGQKKFPPKEGGGGYSSTINNPISGVPTEAQVVIRNYKKAEGAAAA